MLTSHDAYTNLPADVKEAFLRAHASVKHTQTETLKDCPGDLTVLGRTLQAVLRVATAITVTPYFGPNEELGIAFLLSVFDGDALSLARTALADTTPSDGATFRLHGAFLTVLRAYLPPRAAKMWRDACNDFSPRERTAQVPFPHTRCGHVRRRHASRCIGHLRRPATNLSGPTSSKLHPGMGT
jgi:hypothetical protein